MNRILFAWVALCLPIIVLVSSCSKKDKNESITTSVADKTKLNSLFEVFRTIPQNFRVKAGISQMVIGAAGTKLRFYPGSFKDENGNAITSGDIDLQFVEMYRPGSMIANRATTMTDNNFLVSGGQVYLKATMNGKTVNAGKYGISYANARSGDPWALYPGSTDNEDSVVTWGRAMASTGTFCVTGTFDTTGTGVTGGLYYRFDSCTKFEWINCDRLLSTTAPRTKVHLAISDTTFNFTNTQVYMVVPSINSVAIMSNYDRSLHSFGFGGSYTVPEDLVVSFIVMGVKDGTYYYYESLDQRVTTNMMIGANTMSIQSIDYIKDRLSSF